MLSVLLERFVKQPEKFGTEFCWRSVKPAKKVIGVGWFRTHGVPGFNKRVLRTLARASCPSNRARFKRFWFRQGMSPSAPQTRRVRSVEIFGSKFMDAVSVAIVILWFTITLLAIIAMWKLSHRTPKGTVLIFSILLIALSFVIEPSNWRMLYF